MTKFCQNAAFRLTLTFTQSPSSSRLWMTKLQKLEIHSGLKEVVSTLWLEDSWPVCLGRTQGGQETAKIFHTLERVFRLIFQNCEIFSKVYYTISDLRQFCIKICDFDNSFIDAGVTWCRSTGTLLSLVLQAVPNIMWLLYYNLYPSLKHVALIFDVEHLSITAFTFTSEPLTGF